jgi:hypothetical protein
MSDVVSIKLYYKFLNDYLTANENKMDEYLIIDNFNSIVENFELSCLVRFEDEDKEFSYLKFDVALPRKRAWFIDFDVKPP